MNLRESEKSQQQERLDWLINHHLRTPFLFFFFRSKRVVKINKETPNELIAHVVYYSVVQTGLAFELSKSINHTHFSGHVQYCTLLINKHLLFIPFCLYTSRKIAHCLHYAFPVINHKFSQHTHTQYMLITDSVCNCVISLLFFLLFTFLIL